MTVDWKNAVEHEPTEPSGSALFAEDARIEMGGMVSLIGVMAGGNVRFNEFPATLRKLAVISLLILPGAVSRNSTLALRLDVPGADSDKPFWEEVISPPPSIDDEELPSGMKVTAHKAAHIAILQEIPISQPGSIVMRAYVNGSIITMGMIDVQLTDPEDK